MSNTELDASPLPSRGQLSWLITLLVLVVACMGVVIGVLINGQNATETQKWEYKIEAPEDVLFEIKVNELGREGWELVSARRATGSGYGDSASYEMIFKRPLAKGAVDPAAKK